MNKKIMGIYKITNKINEKIYIGSSIDIKRRWNEHKRQLNLSIHNNIYLQNSWIKYGKDNFEFDILEIVEATEKLIEREQYYVDIYGSYNKEKGYNVAIIVNSPMSNRKHTDDTKQLMRNKKLGTRWSEDHKEIRSKQEKGKPKIKNRKVVYQFNINGELIKQWDSVSIVANEMNVKISSISNNCIGKTNSSCGFIWSFNKDLKITENVNYGLAKEVVQLDIDGNFIKLWSSAKEASISLGLDASSITKTCKGKNKTSGGFVWMYSSEYYT